MSLSAGLGHGLQALGLALSQEAQAKLVAYLALVEKWNSVYNLTAVRDPRQMLAHHLLDSLAVSPHVTGTSLVDVGSGAGLPGIPLALARPDTAVTLVDSSHKKSAFLKQVAIELALENVEVVCARIESWEAPRRYDVVISRAFSDLAEFASVAGRLTAEGGVLAAMKGVHPFEELAQLPAPYRMRAVIPLTVPGLDAQRHLVLLERD
ncbi:MAG TPA: 16S rRNA (guanine(527)-N(7))-methyltransferase RsmG [Burkholderiales bacterium]|nr:16S rRNA (guanine(527)-N(7))-methyltransferase RsmG [Burkholderiales bacterium]